MIAAFVLAAALINTVSSSPTPLLPCIAKETRSPCLQEDGTRSPLCPPDVPDEIFEYRVPCQNFCAWSFPKFDAGTCPDAPDECCQRTLGASDGFRINRALMGFHLARTGWFLDSRISACPTDVQYLFQYACIKRCWGVGHVDGSRVFEDTALKLPYTSQSFLAVLKTSTMCDTSSWPRPNRWSKPNCTHENATQSECARQFSCNQQHPCRNNTVCGCKRRSLWLDDDCTRCAHQCGPHAQCTYNNPTTCQCKPGYILSTKDGLPPRSVYWSVRGV